MVQVDGDHMCHNFRNDSNATYLKHMNTICYCFDNTADVLPMYACEMLPQFDGLVPERRNSFANAEAF